MPRFHRPVFRKFFRPAILTALLLAAYILQSTIPAGFMPGNNGPDGGYELVICSGMGIKTIHVGPDGVPVAPGKKGDFCAYQILASQKKIMAAPPIVPPPLQASVSAFNPAPAATEVAPPTLPSSARGPPSFPAA